MVKYIIIFLLLSPCFLFAQGIGTSNNSSLQFITNNFYRGQLTPEGYFLFGSSVNHNNELIQDSGKSYFNGDMQIVGNLNLANQNNSVNIGFGTSPNGYSGVFLGYQAGLSYTGGFSIAIGRSTVSGAGSAARQNSIGFQSNTNPGDADNCTFGSYTATTSLGGNNSLFGNYVGYNASTDAYSNSAIGFMSLYMLSHGSYNSTWGGYAGYSTTVGGSNTFGGYSAGYYNTTGSRNIYLGSNAGGTEAHANDSIDIGGVFEGKRSVPYTGASIIGGMTYSLITISGNYTLTASDHAVVFTTTATATLPGTSLYGINKGHEFVIINADSANTVTITPAAGSINQKTSVTTTKYRTTITYDGTNYYTD